MKTVTIPKEDLTGKICPLMCFHTEGALVFCAKANCEWWDNSEKCCSMRCLAKMYSFGIDVKTLRGGNY